MKKNNKPESWGRYKVEAVILIEGINPHIITRINKFPFEIKYNEKTYTIKEGGLFEKKIGFFKKIKNLIQLIKAEYLIVFRENEMNPIIRYDSVVAPEVLKVARSSRAVTKMIKEWFKGRGIPFNKWVFVLLVATVATVIYAKMTGRI